MDIRKQEYTSQKIFDRLAKLEARIIKLEEAIAYIRTCYLTANVKEKIDKILES